MQALNPQRTSDFSGCNLLVLCVITCVVCMCVHISVCVCVIVIVVHLLLTVEVRNITNFSHKTNNTI